MFKIAIVLVTTAVFATLLIAYPVSRPSATAGSHKHITAVTKRPGQPQARHPALHLVSRVPKPEG